VYIWQNSALTVHHFLAIKVSNFNSAKANNSDSIFREVTPKHYSFRSLCLTSSTKIWNWSVLGWPQKRCRPN